METNTMLPRPLSVLLTIGSALLLWSIIRLGFYIAQECVEVYHSKDTFFYQLMMTVHCIFLLALVLLLSIGSYLLIATAWNWPEQAFNFHEINKRNTYLLVVASLVAYYILFLPHSTDLDFYWVLIFPLFILPIQWNKGSGQTLYTLGALGVIGFICCIKLGMQYNGTLLSGLPPIFSASLLSYVLAGTWVYYHTRKIPDRQTRREYQLILTLLLGTLGIFYIHSVLKVVNCRYDPMQKIVSYHATVVQKCPPYGEYSLSVHYYRGEESGGMLLPVSAKFFHQVKEGDTFTLQLHSGLFGWAWYHDGLGMRIISPSTSKK